MIKSTFQMVYLTNILLCPKNDRIIVGARVKHEDCEAKQIFKDKIKTG